MTPEQLKKGKKIKLELENTIGIVQVLNPEEQKFQPSRISVFRGDCEYSIASINKGDAPKEFEIIFTIIKNYFESKKKRLEKEFSEL
jgi:hypothetical protein